ncbi:hypothetical protein [Halomonas elongata]|uniref:hypothetical protein n=1 Tax=Halomonas elongata TaxID=2746 RepID=UPI00186B7157|nr:hypothetical protein [Halomonas elongata]MBW5798614.1 hypothetical protein [Halomonas elongata]
MSGLAQFSPDMRMALLRYTSPEFSYGNPLADLETLTERTLADVVTQLSVRLLAAGRDDDVIEDALVSLRGQL